jgi:hypothetical protein
MRHLRRWILAVMVIASLAGPAGAHAATWKLESLSLPAKGTEGELRGVSCFSASACTAVGHYFNGSIWGAMGNEWNGTSWSVASVEANPGSKNGDLWSVTCLTALRCRAVGAYGNAGTGMTLAESSNKGVWTHITTPNPKGSAPELLGISCVSTEYCVATGHYNNTEGKNAVMAEEWNVEAWVLMSPIENPEKDNGKLWSVSCLEVEKCRAVGGWGTFAGLGVAGSETLNGKVWTATKVEEPGAAEFGELFSISCKTANSCMAVGVWREGVTKKTRLLADHWNGTSWSLSLAEGPSGETESELRGVSCTAVETCIAVGEYRNSSKKELTLAEIWNGKKWEVQTTPNPTEAAGSILEAISCPEAEVCNAVGHDINSSNVVKPIAEHL